MGWRKQLKWEIEKNKAFRSEVRDWIESTDRLLKGLVIRIAKNESLDVLNERLLQQNEGLMDRIMSRSLPELKTFTIPGDDLRPIIDEYKIEEDEDLAGEVIESLDVQHLNNPGV